MASVFPTPRDLLGLVVRGFAMGIVEVLPGISGGTVALLTGIYDRLVTTLSDMAIWAKNLLQKRDLDLLKLARALAVIAPLALGMIVGFVVSVLSVSHVLDTRPMLVWGRSFWACSGCRDFYRRLVENSAPRDVCPGGIGICSFIESAAR